MKTFIRYARTAGMEEAKQLKLHWVSVQNWSALLAGATGSQESSLIGLLLALGWEVPEGSSTSR